MKKILCIFLTLCLLAVSGCGNKTVTVPFGSTDRLGTEYTRTVAELTKAGFLQVNTDPVNTAHKDNEGKVESISIDGKTTFKKSQEFSEKVPVVVRYYRLIDKKDSGNGVSFFR